MKKYNIKYLVKNTYFEVQRKDKELQDFQNKEMVEREYFNFDIERMKKAMECEGVMIPNFDNVEELSEWLNREGE